VANASRHSYGDGYFLKATAITGLVVALVQIGVFGGHDNSSAPKTGTDVEAHKSAGASSVAFPSYEGNAINVWIVGSPHTGAVPSAELPHEIADNARSIFASVDINTCMAVPNINIA
jgi:hypothetical protein